MKKTFNVLMIIAFVAVIGFTMIACGDSGGNSDLPDPSLLDLSGTISITGTLTVGQELTANYTGTETVAYQWKRGSANVGTNSNKYTPDQAGSYTITVSASGYNSKTSAAVTVITQSDFYGLPLLLQQSYYQ